MKRNTERLNNTAGKVGLKLAERRPKNENNPRQPNATICKRSTNRDRGTFIYLSSILDEKGGADSDALSQSSNSRAAISPLNPVWRSTVTALKTKIRLFNSNVQKVMSCGSECWKTFKKIPHKLRAFVRKCFRSILRIRWPMNISNKRVREKCNQEDIMVELASRRWSWIGHVQRKPPNGITKEALYLTTDGTRRRGRPQL